jgi:hypothetical protein
MRQRQRVVRVAVSVGLLAAIAACGGDSPRPPVVVITPEPVRGVIAQTGFSGFQADTWVSIEVPLSQRGILDVTVDWTFPDSWIYVYLGNTKCDYAQLVGRTCPFILSSRLRHKPRVLVTQTLGPPPLPLPLPAARQHRHRSDLPSQITLGLTVAPAAA